MNAIKSKNHSDKMKEKYKMMKARKKRIQDLLFMLSGAIFTSVIVISFENIEFSISRLTLYVIAGSLVGYGLRELVPRTRTSAKS